MWWRGVEEEEEQEAAVVVVVALIHRMPCPVPLAGISRWPSLGPGWANVAGVGLPGSCGSMLGMRVPHVRVADIPLFLS